VPLHPDILFLDAAPAEPRGRPAYPSYSGGDGHQGSLLRRKGAPLRILIVEDEALAALDIQSIVAESGGEVVGIAMRGAEAVEKAAAAMPDLVLMDVHLIGDIDGIEAARRIRGRCHVPVLFVTAHGDADTLRRMFDVVPMAPVIKPIAPRRLCDAILRACRE
jgi:CheY-like chemotaxis protein